MFDTSQQTAVESRIALLEEAGYERQAIDCGSSVEAAFKGEHSDAVLAKEDGSLQIYIYNREAGVCSCGEHETHNPSMGSPAEADHRRRRQKACDHVEALLDAEDKQCPECGSFEFRTREFGHGNRVVMVETNCADCHAIW
jgi:RNA polymerase subunit RPABC4/transcription elongation factor Spt4